MFDEELPFSDVNEEPLVTVIAYLSDTTTYKFDEIYHCVYQILVFLENHPQEDLYTNSDILEDLKENKINIDTFKEIADLTIEYLGLKEEYTAEQFKHVHNMLMKLQGKEDEYRLFLVLAKELYLNQFSDIVEAALELYPDEISDLLDRDSDTITEDNCLKIVDRFMVLEGYKIIDGYFVLEEVK